MANNLMGSTIAAAVTAAAFSPRVRKALRGGAVQGLAGVLVAGDALSSFARGIGRGFQEASASAGTAAGSAEVQTPASAMEVAQEAARAAQEAARAAQQAAEAAQAAAANRAPTGARKAKKPKAPAKTRESKS
jgi:hypothetical protein